MQRISKKGGWISRTHTAARGRKKITLTQFFVIMVIVRVSERIKSMNTASVLFRRSLMVKDSAVPSATAPRDRGTGLTTISISRSAAEVRWYVGYRHGTPSVGAEASGQLYWATGVPPLGKANVLFSDSHVETLSGAQVAAIDGDSNTSTGFKERTFFKRGISGISWDSN